MSHPPTHGHTKDGAPVHKDRHDYHPAETGYQRFNKKLAVLITTKVGTMTSAYIFAVLALCSLPAILSAFNVFSGWFPDWLIKPSIIALVAWIAQAFLQLVLLPIIMVGQNVQGAASDARASKTLEDTEMLITLLDIRTEGGIRDLKEHLDSRLNTLQAPAPAPRPRKRATPAKAAVKAPRKASGGASKPSKAAKATKRAR